MKLPMKQETDKDPLEPMRITMFGESINFTQKAHLLFLLPALFISLVAGILEPALAVFFGKFFDVFSNYEGDRISEIQLLDKILVDVQALIDLGAATLLVKGGYFASRLVFGELQAQSVRNELFEKLLRKDLEWFETRTSGC
jgi:ATP-binding cassette, subfamily B (MDR/TAP), member 1